MSFQKLIPISSFDFGQDLVLCELVKDMRTFQKSASSEVVNQWGEISRVKGHELVHLIACGATEFVGSNSWADAFGTRFCRDNHPTFRKFASLYENHEMDDQKKYGFVSKSGFHDPVGRIELLVAADVNKCASWLGEMERGERVDFSMGFHCERERCDVCNHASKWPRDRCVHMWRRPKKVANFDDIFRMEDPRYGPNRILPNGQKCFVHNEEGFWNDISHVKVGADRTAMGIRKVASQSGVELPYEVMDMTRESTFADQKRSTMMKLASFERKIRDLGSSKYRGESIDPISELGLREIRSMPSGEAAQLLQKKQAMMGVEDFAKYIFGTDQLQKENISLEKTAAHADFLFEKLGEDPDRFHKIASSDEFDPDNRRRILFSPLLFRELDRYHFDSDRVIAEAISNPITKQASNRTRAEEALTPQEGAFLDAWASYKVASIHALNIQDDHEKLFAAALVV